ncbi:MAG TPA: bifunctional diaminohydroxyphosphoribosylaminopyrimidine deaminase/5-amino-6-(5-phosphoribosylamino)uracil reductase RibD [Candidatus Sulfotelmatobacter sp.]
MPDRTVDEQFLQQALDLARQGVGLTSPNPCVGAVIVDAHGDVAGAGTHTYDGVKHAEVLALEQAGEKARSGTLYINLEPCSHQGRTPPCADAVIASGIRRVVASMDDPNSVVAGRGFDRLRAAGVQVEVGAMAEQARRLNESFARYIRGGIPFVTLKSAMTLNGKIAPSRDASNTALLEQDQSNRASGTPPGGWLTGQTARAHVQQMRHEHDALLTGVGTVLADNPLLTDRTGFPRRRPLLRVILDSQLRTPFDSRLVGSAVSGDVLIFCSSASKDKKTRLCESGVRVEDLPPNNDGQIDLHAVIRRLGQLEITSLMIEAGAVINGAALAAGIVDKVFLFYAPKIFSNPDAVPFTAGVHSGGAIDAVQIKSLSFHRFGEDFAFEGYFRDPYQH